MDRLDSRIEALKYFFTIQYPMLLSIKDKIIDCFNNNGKLICIGNGGSMTQAMHFAEELTGRYKSNRQPLAAITISDPAHISCVANDFGYSNIFSRSIEALAKPEDLLIIFSISGNSENLILAAKKAQQLNVETISFTGNPENGLKNLSKIQLNIESGDGSVVQELHLTSIHLLLEEIENTLFS